jgi:hypothetical protein
VKLVSEILQKKYVQTRNFAKKISLQKECSPQKQKEGS